MPQDRARKAADIVLSASIAAGITTSKAIESVNRDAHIYTLRGMRTVAMEPMTAVVIASRVGLCRQEVFKALPYLVTIGVLIMTSLRKKREDQPPAALGLAYFREDRG